MRRLDTTDDLVFNEFTFSDEIVTPTEGNVEIKLLLADGSIFDTFVFSHEVSLIVSDSDLPAIEVGNVSSSCFAHVKFISNGKHYKYFEMIRREAFRPFTINEDSVRSALGVQEEELPNHSIDIFARYEKSITELGIDVFSDITKVPLANEYLLFKECLWQIPMLEMKLFKTKSIDDVTETRLGKYDFDKMKERFEALANKALSDIDEAQSIPTVPPLLLVTRDDIFVG